MWKCENFNELKGQNIEKCFKLKRFQIENEKFLKWIELKWI